MPQEYNNILVVTSDELVPAFYNSIKTLQSTIARYRNKDYGIKRIRRGGNGGQMLVSYDSLPPEIQQCIPDPRKHANILEMFYKVDAAATQFFSEYEFEDGTYLSMEHQEEYLINASVLKAAVLLKSAREYERRTKGGSMVGIMTSICKDVTAFNKTLQAKHNVAHNLPHSEKRFKEVFKKFSKEDGEFDFASLISGRLKNENAKKVTDHVLQMLNDMFATQVSKPTRTEVARQYAAFLSGYVEVICQETGEVYDPKDFKNLSDNTIITYLGKWEEKIATYKIRSGDRQIFMKNFKPYHSLEKPAFAGAIISVDDRQPVFHYQDNKRMWFYNAIDLGSEAFTCWVYGKSKEGIIVDFYRQLVRNYTEWGFKLPAEIEAESSLNSSFVNTFLRPGAMFDHVRIEANNARGKRIEAYYRQLRYEYEKQREGWLARPFAQSESNQAGNQKVPVIPYNQIVDGCLKDIEDWNNSPHSVHKDKSRWEVFCEMQHPDLKPTNWKAILPHLGFMTPTSCNTGIIKLQGKEFLLGDHGQIYTGEKLINMMKLVEGRDINVYWLDDNQGQVLKAVIMSGGTIIGEAIPKPTYSRATIERTPSQEAARSTMSAYVQTIEGYMQAKASQISDMLIIDNRERTLNRKFVMPGLKSTSTTLTENAEILEDPEETGTMPVEVNRTFTRNLGDRF